MSKIKTVRKHVTVSIEGRTADLTIERTVGSNGGRVYDVYYHEQFVGEMHTHNEAYGAETILHNGHARMREFKAKSMGAGFDWICRMVVAPMLKAQRFKVGQHVKMTGFDDERVVVTINSPLIRDTQGNLGYYVTGLGPKTFAYSRGLRAATQSNRKQTMNKFVKGQRVTFKPAGKVARLEGMVGQLVMGSVQRDGPDADGYVEVMPDYRMVKGARFPSMGASVPAKAIRAL